MAGRVVAGVLALALWPGSAGADPASDEPLAAIANYREYGPAFASSGQPTREQFRLLRDAGFERVVFLAFSNSSNAVADEDVAVNELGMDYLHVPVEWTSPQPAEFEIFAAYMRQAPEARTLLHCVVNARASAFSFLYRVIHEGVPVAEAKADLDSVWQPNETWRDFIFEVLARHGRSPDCAGCDWTPSADG